MSNFSKSLELKVRTRKEVSEEYGIDSKTLRRWLKKAGIKPKPGLLKPADLKAIYKAFGFPHWPHNDPK